jgi:hypothetical protein
VRQLILKLAILSAVAIVAWWPIAERGMRGPVTVTHVLIPIALAVIALLAWRMLRSLFAALACAAGIAVILFIIYSEFGDQIRPLLEKVFP